MKKRMKKILYISIIAAAFVFVGFGCSKKTVGNEQNMPAENNKTGEMSAAVSKPWIEVVSASSTLFDSEGKVTRELFTGDELEPGSIIGTDKNGLANIYFPDGSVARLDSNTKMTLEIGNYDADSRTLMVRIQLASGKIWSKILKLATPGSFWEVKTSNTVAAVRGTAFGVAFQSGKTRIITAENKVAVKPLDVGTGEPILEKATLVSQGQFLEITPLLIKQIQTDKSITDLSAKVQVAPAYVLDEVWVKRAAGEDALLDSRIEQLRVQGMSDDEAIFEYGAQFRFESGQSILDRRAELNARTEILKTGLQEATSSGDASSDSIMLLNQNVVTNTR